MYGISQRDFEDTYKFTDNLSKTHINLLITYQKKVLKSRDLFLL